MINILLTSAGRRSYIVDYFKATNGIGKVYASNSEYSIALKKADDYFISPLIYSDNYIPSVIDFCRKKKINAVLSLFDIDLLVLAKNQDKFDEAGIQLILAGAPFVEICNDKWKTFLFCKDLGIKTPKTYNSLEDTFVALGHNELSYPLIIKPRWGMASMGIYKVESDLELKVFSEKCKRDIFNSYLKYETASTSELPIIYQEALVGQEYGLDVLNDLNCSYIQTFAKQKVTMRSGETDLGKTVSNLPFKDIAEKISKVSRHKGILSVDCFVCGKDVYVIEMNCRISGHYPLSYLAGFNFPQLLIDWLSGKSTDTSMLNFKENLFIIKDLVPTILREE